MSPAVQRLIKYVLPLIIVAAGIGIAVRMIKSKPAPKRTEPVDHGVLVELAQASTQARQVNLTAQGSVSAAERVVLQPQVAGSVTWVNEKLTTGGLVTKGEPLVRIDRRDYEIALDQRRATVSQARAQLNIEEGQQRVAQREWELFKDRAAQGDVDASLALRAPQRQIAEVNLKAAEAGELKAKLDLDRTTIRAPFNAYVQAENVEIGQTVSAQSQLATLVGTDAYWVQVSVPVDKLGFIAVPGVNATQGAPAIVHQQHGAVRVERKGRVLRLLPEVDPVGRMARVLVEISDPMNLAASQAERGIPLMMGAVVSVDITGRDEASVAVVPRSAVHNGDSIWVYADGTLDIRNIESVWGDEESVWISSGIQPGESYVVSRIATPIQGMKLRTEAAKPTMAAAKPGEGKP